MGLWLLPTDICLVTGGKTGLGAELIILFANYGCQTVSLDLYSLTEDNSIVVPECVNSLSTEHRTGNVATLHLNCDVCDEQSILEAKELIYKRFHRYPSVIILNAAIRGAISSVNNTSTKSLQRIIDVNLGGVIRCAKIFMPEMISMNRGYIVTIASALGMVIPKGFSAYGAAKAGVIGFHEGLSFELADHKKVRTLLVCPGQLDTELFSDVHTPNKFVAPVVSKSKLAEVIFKRIRKGKTHTIYSPLYVRYLPWMKVMTTPLMRTARKISNIDKVYDEAVATTEP